MLVTQKFTIVFGHIGILRAGDKYEEFITNNGTKGKLVIVEAEDKVQINLVLGEGFHGAAINCSQEAYDDNKKKINRILKSIVIKE